MGLAIATESNLLQPAFGIRANLFYNIDNLPTFKDKSITYYYVGTNRAIHCLFHIEKKKMSNCVIIYIKLIWRGMMRKTHRSFQQTKVQTIFSAK